MFAQIPVGDAEIGVMLRLHRVQHHNNCKVGAGRPFTTMDTLGHKVTCIYLRLRTLHCHIQEVMEAVLYQEEIIGEEIVLLKRSNVVKSHKDIFTV